MAKIMALIPCLMLSNNRDINKKSIVSNYELLGLDQFVIYDQCFDDSDFDSRFTYIGHAKERMGWVLPRNELLSYFYNSDYDYAFWIDANSSVSKPTLNDLRTIIDAVKNDKLNELDGIFATLGMWISQDRIHCKSAEDYMQNVHLIPAKCDRSYNWMHGLIHKNFKKYYNQEFYIDERCDTKKGTPDDVYFARLLRNFTNTYVAPTVVVNKPSSKMSCTWANEKGTYEYPPVLFDEVDKYIFECAHKYNYRRVNMLAARKEVILPRIEDEYKFAIKPYESRSKKPKIENERRKISLF